MEQREITAKTKAAYLVSKFKSSFRFIAATMHPAGISGESPGKSSNLSWAARAASKRYEVEMRRDVILTSIDGTLIFDPGLSYFFPFKFPFSI
jgi:hypothetical protein